MVPIIFKIQFSRDTAVICIRSFQSAFPRLRLSSQRSNGLGGRERDPCPVQIIFLRVASGLIVRLNLDRYGAAVACISHGAILRARSFAHLPPPLSLCRCLPPPPINVTFIRDRVRHAGRESEKPRNRAGITSGRGIRVYTYTYVASSSPSVRLRSLRRSVERDRCRVCAQTRS